MHRDFLKMKEKCMRVDEIILTTVIKEISNKISPSLHCLLYWHSQTACPKVHKETDMSACVQACTFICDLTGVLWQLQRVRWLCWAQFLWELQVCVPSAPFQTCWWCRLFRLQSCYPFTSHASIISTRFSYSAENQLVGCLSSSRASLGR